MGEEKKGLNCEVGFDGEFSGIVPDWDCLGGAGTGMGPHGGESSDEA